MIIILPEAEYDITRGNVTEHGVGPAKVRDLRDRDLIDGWSGVRLSNGKWLTVVIGEPAGLAELRAVPGAEQPGKLQAQQRKYPSDIPDKVHLKIACPGREADQEKGITAKPARTDRLEFQPRKDNPESQPERELRR